ncbi:LysR family transcriptional regulator [Bordetella genomosp. 10]|uniref:LysR family transcriptional regulator n=1 Tax=Bordetella genomosp. 10 TaxID=1416804 RepID=A0A261S2F9_9BORD|nr:LysR family transcriptional regulator [Bordetella genomosp. 10]OZI31544.1 LysR family transcriptional regulator [Bordetella genomosp. 10]
MDMRQLRYFVMVAEELSFSRAAERLHMSQPPLSQHIKLLEDDIGVQLFHRTRREVRLTDAGAVFLRESRLLLGQMKTAVSATVRAAQSDAGVLRLGVATSALFHVLPTFVAMVRESYPGVEISVSDMQSQDQIAAVSHGQLDMGLVHIRPDRSKLMRMPIYREHYMAVLPQGHPLAAKADFTLADLADEPMIALSRESGPTVFDAIVASCYEAGFSPSFKHAARSPLTIFQMVRLGFGVALVPRSYASSAYPGVLFRDLPPTAGQVRMEAIWSEKHASGLTLKIAREVLPRLAPEAQPPSEAMASHPASA